MFEKFAFAVVAGIAFQGLILLAGALRLSIAEYLMFPGGYALSPIFPERMHSGKGVALFGLYLIVANVLCYTLLFYILLLLAARKKGVRNG